MLTCLVVLSVVVLCFLVIPFLLGADLQEVRRRASGSGSEFARLDKDDAGVDSEELADLSASDACVDPITREPFRPGERVYRCRCRLLYSKVGRDFAIHEWGARCVNGGHPLEVVEESYGAESVERWALGDEAARDRVREVVGELGVGTCGAATDDGTPCPNRILHGRRCHVHR